MNKTKKNLLVFICAMLIVSYMPCNSAQAANGSEVVTILPQITTERYSSYSSVFKDAFAFDVANFTPGYTYDIYYRPSKSKRWKLYKTYVAPNEESDDYWYFGKARPKGCSNIVHFWITKTTPNTKYYVRVKTRDTKKWSKTVAFWSTTKSPKYRKTGRTVTWNKINGASGYIVGMRRYVYWEWHDGLPVWVNNYEYYTDIVSNRTKTYICPKGYSLIGVYAYAKHGKYYYVDGYGLFSKKNKLLDAPEWPEYTYKLRKKRGLSYLFDA